MVCSQGVQEGVGRRISQLLAVAQLVQVRARFPAYSERFERLIRDLELQEELVFLPKWS